MALQVRFKPKFPGRIAVGPGLSLTKAAGVWTFALNVGSLSAISSIAVADRDIYFLHVHNSDTGLHSKFSIENLVAAIPAGGNVVGPASSTDNALARFNGATGLAIQNSGIIIDDSNNVSGLGTLGSAAHTITSTSESALAVGRQGATNPALKVNALAASCVTGIEISAAAAGSGVGVAAISSDTNEMLRLNAKGSGTIRLGDTSTGLVESSRAVVPTLSDGSALGTTSQMWSDLFLANGAVINFNNGDVTISHSADALAVDGGSMRFNNNVGISAAASATIRLLILGAANAYSQHIQGSSTSGQSFGLLLDAGTTSADAALSVRSAAGSNFFAVRGDGIITMSSTLDAGSPTDGSVRLSGGLSVAKATWIGTTLNVAGVATLASGTATPAGGSTAARLLFGTTAGFGIYYGSGAPTVSAAQGSLYLRSDGSSTSTRAYINNSAGSGTTWTAITTAA